MDSVLRWTAQVVLLLLFTPSVSPTDLPDDIRIARERCREVKKWPEFPPRIAGCPVDWDDPASIEVYVDYPIRRRITRNLPDPPTIPADEDVGSPVLILEYLISAEGKVMDVCVLRSTSPTVDAYFLQVARETEFQPGMVCGELSAFTMFITVNHHAWNWPREPS